MTGINPGAVAFDAWYQSPRLYLTSINCRQAHLTGLNLLGRI